jgi:protocatechuate 3,4-dioxygenase beta subunit
LASPRWCSHLAQAWTERHEHHTNDFVELRPGQLREAIDFTLAPGGVAISGTVLDISGGVIEGAWVTATNDRGGPGRGRSVVWTDASGRFEAWVAPHHATLIAEADGYASGGRGRYVAAPSSTAELVLTPESVIVGRVVVAGSGEPVAGVVITARSSSFLDANGTARSDDGGRFRVTKLQPGIYDLVARGDALYGEAGQQIHVALAETSDEVVITLHPARLVTGLVRYAGAEAKPCASDYVRLRGRDDSTKWHSGEIRSGGEVEIPGVLTGSYAVDVSCAGGVSGAEYPDLEVADAAVDGQVWEVREGQAIAGEVVDANGEPIAGAVVYAAMQLDAGDPRGQQTKTAAPATEAAGQFRVAGLLPGRYQLRVWGPGPRVEPIDVELEPGADIHDIHLELPATGTVRGQVRDARGTPLVSVSVRGAGVDRPSYAGAVTDDEGRFVLESVEVGEVRVTAYEGMTALRSPGTGDDDEQGVVIDVVVGDNDELTLTVEATSGRISGRVLDETGAPVADAFVSHRRMSDSAAAGQGESKRSLRWGFYDRPVLTDVDGKFVIEGLNEAASYALGAFRKGGGEALVDGIRPGESVDMTIVATGELAGRLVVEGGVAPDRAMLTLVESREGLRRGDALFRTGGEFRFQELPPGTYTLTVDSTAGAAEIEGIEVAAGEVVDDLLVTLTPRVRVKGRLVDIDTREPVPGMIASVSARKGAQGVGTSEPGDEHISDAGGRFEIANARTGKVRLILRPRNWGGDNKYSWAPIAMVTAGKAIE